MNDKTRVKILKHLESIESGARKIDSGVAKLQAEIKALREGLQEAVDLIEWSLDFASCVCGHPAHKEDRYVEDAKAFIAKHENRKKRDGGSNDGDNFSALSDQR